MDTKRNDEDDDDDDGNIKDEGWECFLAHGYGDDGDADIDVWSKRVKKKHK